MKNEQPLLSISLIGAGNLGKSLARLWNDNRLLSIKQIFTSSQFTAQNAVEFIGAGAACSELLQLEKTDILLIAVPDDQINIVCDTLFTLPNALNSTVVFHCSGVLSSTAINRLSERGAVVASVHPIKSFASPKTAITSFSGTFCGVEGDQAALKVLTPLFSDLGGHCLSINPDNKALYHCAAVFANNYLVSLVECAQELYKLSGISREQSMQLMAPMLRETCENLINFGTQKSLTGPIARGDEQTVVKHLEALSRTENPLTLELYQTLGKVALNLKDNGVEDLNANEIRNLLSAEK